ncbi:Fe-Mn family superoxide dismutase [Spirosoma oryzae]|uniref:Superoxide dismutase n=1 Tax=Spirosoma oryzae TaxID=1469603 RepID=A0A2T0SM42_9BACT|nr:superoxide dismutase [Spirosoma oryzae]PRY34474.1 Fe-Mn family superoxide dismutase [Spirosoma oryzae]
MNRSEFLKLAFGASAGLMAFRSFGITPAQTEGPFKLPPLPYEFAALEPHIDKMTMEIHHDKHHKAYVDNLNKAVAGTDMAKMDIDALVKSISSSTPAAVRNNGGGHWNHSFFWTILSPKGGGAPKGALAEAINKKFGSFDKFKEEWAKAAGSRFGSGWVWLIKSGDGVEIVTTPNQDNPLMALAEKKGTPLMGLDVWEHAYYLKYQNKRPEYVTAAWNVYDWDKIAKNYAG